MRALGVHLEDIEERFILGSGRGGQKINKTSSRVQLIHHPSGMVVTNQTTRSQSQNRLLALKDLCWKIEEHRRKEALDHRQAVEKERRRKRKRTAGGKEKMLREKRFTSLKKQSRRRPLIEE